MLKYFLHKNRIYDDFTILALMEANLSKDIFKIYFFSFTITWRIFPCWCLQLSFIPLQQHRGVLLDGYPRMPPFTSQRETDCLVRPGPHASCSDQPSNCIPWELVEKAESQRPRPPRLNQMWSGGPPTQGARQNSDSWPQPWRFSFWDRAETPAFLARSQMTWRLLVPGPFWESQV